MDKSLLTEIVYVSGTCHGPVSHPGCTLSFFSWNRPLKNRNPNQDTEDK